MESTDESFFSRKISIEPDLGDQRKSIWKALPAPSITPKRVLMKYRLSAIFPFAFAGASLALTFVMVLVGGKDTFRGNYLVALTTSRLDQGKTGFEGTSMMTWRSGIPAQDLKENAGNAASYYLYLQSICSGPASDYTDSQTVAIVIERCESWSKVASRLVALTHDRETSGLASQTDVSASLVARLAMSSILLKACKAAFAFIIIVTIGSILSAASALLAIIFPHSRLLIYFNIFWPSLASMFAFTTAVMLTALVMGLTWSIRILDNGAGLYVQQGGVVLLSVWLVWLLMSLACMYWTAIWFVEVRRSSFMRRMRDDGEIGNWRGIGKEVWRDMREQDDQ